MHTKKPAKNKRSTKSKKTGYIVILSSVLLALIVFLAYYFGFVHRVLPRVMVGNIELGGASTEKADRLMHEAMSSVTNINIAVDDNETETISLDRLGISYDPAATLRRVYSLGKEGSWYHKAWLHLRSLFLVNRIDPVINIDQVKYDKVLNEVIFNKYETKAKEVTVKVTKDNQVEVIPGESGLVLDKDELNSNLRSRLNYFSEDLISISRSDFKPEFTVDDAPYAVTQAQKIIASELSLKMEESTFKLSIEKLGAWITTRVVYPKDPAYSRAVLNGVSANGAMLLVDIDKEQLLKYVKTLAFEQINRDAVDAGVRFANGQIQVFQPSMKGYKVKEDETVEAIYKSLIDRSFDINSANVDLVFEVLQPDVTENSLADLGIKELIGKAATSYSTSPSNRKHNIATGAKSINGTILKDGEEFSAVEALGEVDAASGYLPELVISNNQLERQYGGGLCQPITTLFRAVIDAGLPITARSNHSRRVSYYEKASNVSGVRINWNTQYANLGSSLVGYDATVYIPEPDLKFMNDTGKAVLIQAYVTNNNEVTFEIYGTNDGRNISVSKSQVLYTKPSPEPQFQPDPTKPSNTMELVEKAVPGAKTSFNYTIIYADGKQETQTFESFYRPIPAQYLVGTAEPVPVPESQPEAAPAQ